MFSLNTGLEYFFNNISAKLTTDIFLWITLFAFLWAIIQSIRGKAINFVTYAPTLLTSLGILGTFVGVIIGLLDFDALNIDDSVPKLLEGLKTAFITSIWGTGLSIIFKIIAPFITFIPTPKKPITTIISSGPEAMIEGLQAIINNTNKHNELLIKIQKNLAGTKESSLAGQLKLTRADAIDHHKEMMRSIIQQTELLTKMQINLTGNEESSLIGQLRLLRLDINEFKNKSLEIIELDRKNHNEFANKLWQQLETFAQMLSKSATEQVINALKAVIADFNSKLTEQFGQNFKELNTAVGHLVTWQDNYRIQLEQMRDQYAQGVIAINKTSDAITTIANTTQQIPVTMQQLQTIIEVNQHQLAELAQHLAAFQDMRDKAVAAVPIMQQQIESMMTDIKFSVDHVNEHYTVLLNKSDKYIQDHDQQTRQLLDMINTHAQGLATTMTGETKAIAQTLQTAGQQTQRDIQNTQQQVEISITDMQKQLKTAIESSLTTQTQLMQTAANNFYTEMQNVVSNVVNNVEITFKNSIEQFTTSVQTIQGNLDNTSSTLITQTKAIDANLSNTVTMINTHAQGLVTTMTGETKAIAQTLQTAGQQTQRDIQNTQQQVAISISEMQKQLKIAIESSASMQINTMNSIAEGFRTEMSKAITTIRENTVSTLKESVNTQFKAMDEMMEKEISRVIQTMGNYLAQITNKLNNDFKQWDETMKKLLETTRNLNEQYNRTRT